jgi:hypothetical protein
MARPVLPCAECFFLPRFSSKGASRLFRVPTVLEQSTPWPHRKVTPVTRFCGRPRQLGPGPSPRRNSRRCSSVVRAATSSRHPIRSGLEAVLSALQSLLLKFKPMDGRTNPRSSRRFQVEHLSVDAAQQKDALVMLHRSGRQQTSSVEMYA